MLDKNPCATTPSVERPNGKALLNAQPLDKHMASSDERASRLAMYLYDFGITEPYAPHLPRIRDQIVAVVLNLYSAYLNDPERYVRYSRDPGRYTEGRYNRLPVTWRMLCRIVAVLEREGLLEHVDGTTGADGYSDGWQSRMRATPKLVKLMVEGFGFTPDVIQETSDETIILKGPKDEDGHAERIDYKEKPATDRMRKNLHVINSALGRVWIDLEITEEQLKRLNRQLSRRDKLPIDFRRKRLRRVFNNGKFNLGGRFYHGWWQGIPKRYRHFIRMNGEETVELDFSGMHFNIFYSDVGAIPPDDPYVLPDLEPGDRDVVKLALNAMINAEDEADAAKGIRHKIWKKNKKKPKEQWMKLPKAYPTAKALIAALKEAHAPIAHLIASGEGRRAQFIDSKIAERVMLTLTAEGIPVLPVHDSFIVPAKHEDRLREAMGESFKAETRATCPIDCKVPKPEWLAEDEAIREANKHSRTDPYIGYHSRMANWAVSEIAKGPKQAGQEPRTPRKALKA